MKQISTSFKTILLALALFTLHTQAQKQVNFWYFGTFAGLDFNSGSPVVVTGSLNTTEGCSAMSDANGNLLFYTDGVNVWNKNHVVMPNGTGLLGDPSTTQSALIVKKPGSSTLYYIFTLPAEGTGNFCYSVVDMTLDGGNGDVTTKNTVVKSNVTEKLSAVHHCNGTDIWVAIHELNSNSFYVYPLTAVGLGTVVVSNVGRVYTRVHGQMKFNNAGTKIACCRDTMVAQGPPYQGTAWLDVLSFNNQTGAVSSPTILMLNNWQKTYGCEFSPDNSKVYASYYDQSGINGGNSEIIQYNLTATNVAASGVTVASSLDPDILRAMQLGPNGKIYIAKGTTPFLCAINSPNLAGAACNYSADVINVDPGANGNLCMLGLPGFQTSYFNSSFPAIQTCSPSSVPETSQSLALGIYFNSSDKMVLEGNFANGPHHFTIYNMQGSLIKEISFEVNNSGFQKFEFDVSLRPGIYLSRMFFPEGSMQAKWYKE